MVHDSQFLTDLRTAGDVRVWELNNINLLTDLNYNLTRHSVELNQRTIYSAAVRITPDNHLTFYVGVQAGAGINPGTDILWINADPSNPRLMDDSVPAFFSP